MTLLKKKCKCLEKAQNQKTNKDSNWELQIKQICLQKLFKIH